MADPGFSGGGIAWRTRGMVREGVPPPAGGPGAWPPGKFFANRRRKYAFSRPCLGSICLFHHFIFGTEMSIVIFLSQVNALMKLTTFLE